MVSVCSVPARGGRLCEHFGGYKTINPIPLPLRHVYLMDCSSLHQVLLNTRVAEKKTISKIYSICYPSKHLYLRKVNLLTCVLSMSSCLCELLGPHCP